MLVGCFRIWTIGSLSCAAGAIALFCAAASAMDLEEGFREPSKEARPSLYWLWLNGYVNREHAARELRAFRDAGIGGVCIFDMGARGPTGTLPPAGPTFLAAESAADVAFAVRTAGALGMDVQLSVASSWDMGGTWVEPRHASMGLFISQADFEGPAAIDIVLPLPPIPDRAPRKADGAPVVQEPIAVLAVPAERCLPGHDFVFRLDPPGLRRLHYAVLCNTPSEDPGRFGPSHLFVKDFSIAVSTTEPREECFREVLRAALEPHARPQRFELPPTEARWVRLRILSGHNPAFDRVELGEFQLFDAEGRNVAGSHEADRTRDGAELLYRPSTLGFDGAWTADNIHDGVMTGPSGSWSSAGPPAILVRDPSDIVDLSAWVEPSGRLRWQAPPGRWIVLRFVCANTGERLKVPSPNSDGLATDHFNPEATQAFLEHVIGALRTKLGRLDATALRQLYLASYEVRGRVWTPRMGEHFRRLRGYDLTPFLPVFAGAIVVDEETTERFLYDYRKTLSDVLIDAYYRTACDVAHAAGLEIEAEAGGPGPPIHQVPVDALKALGTIDQVRGEFWPRRPEAHRLWVVKETACAAHVYGKRRVHMEAFTSMHHWQDGPSDLKPSADRALCEGANHFVWHTAAHQPPEAGKPGWVYGAGTHLNLNLVWWPKARPFLDYLARCSFLLQQGYFVADVCYYYGDHGFNFVGPKRVDPSLGFGYDYDVIDREALLGRLSVRDGRLALPDGTSYAVLVLPDRPDIDPDVLRRVEKWVAEGATVVGPKPSRATGLADHHARDRQVREIADRLWGKLNGEDGRNGDGGGAQRGENVVGRGRIVWGRPLREVLESLGAGPDLQVESGGDVPPLDFIHRRTEEADIYFVRNTRPEAIRCRATFRVAARAPEFWEPDTSRITPCFVYENLPNGTSLELALAPFGSTFVVFRRAEGRPPALRWTRRVASREPAEGELAVERPRATVTAWDGRRIALAAERDGVYELRAEDGRMASIEVAGLPAPIRLEGPWRVRFAGSDGFETETTFDSLVSWTQHEDEAIRHFAGIATYTASFELPPDWLAQDRGVVLDLGRLWSVGEVRVNGRSLGIVWKPPYRVEATAALRPGTNTLEIDVANTWSNRLVGDAALAAERRRTRTNITHSNGVAWRDVPLLPSGLFGPVRLVPLRVCQTPVAD